MKTDVQSENELIFGKNTILSFLETQAENKAKGTRGAQIHKLYMGSGFRSDARTDRIKELAHELKIPVAIADRRKLEELVGREEHHQGVVAQISAVAQLELDQFLQQLAEKRDKLDAEKAKAFMDQLTVVIVDGIEDPHNLGAIVRSAEAAGFNGLCLPARRSASLTGTVAKTSSGALATLPIIKINNLVRSIEQLKDFGFWIVGLEGTAESLYTEIDLARPLAIVVGSEGTGISRLVSENCDLLARIPMLGKTESLNASVAAGIVFYEVVRQRHANSKAVKSK